MIILWFQPGTLQRPANAPYRTAAGRRYVDGDGCAVTLQRHQRMDHPVNRFQAMARIMTLLADDGTLKPGTRRYRIARKMVARTIDRLGPDAALVQVVDRRPHLLEQIDTLMSLEAAGITPSQLDF